jgi:hypothetical protein
MCGLVGVREAFSVLLSWNVSGFLDCIAYVPLTFWRVRGYKRPEWDFDPDLPVNMSLG